MAADERLTWLATPPWPSRSAERACSPIRSCADRIAHLRRHGPSPDPAATADLDAVLVSHLHRDHLDVPSLRQLDPDGRRWYVPRGAGRLPRRFGFTRCTANWPSARRAAVGGARVRAVPAIHDGRRFPGPGRRRSPRRSASRSGVPRPCTSRVTPSVFDGDGGARPAGIDVALLPVWGWGPGTLGAGHMDPAACGARGRRSFRPRSPSRSTGGRCSRVAWRAPAPRRRSSSRHGPSRGSSPSRRPG